jgi:hypothetical protein
MGAAISRAAVSKSIEGLTLRQMPEDRARLFGLPPETLRKTLLTLRTQPQLLGIVLGEAVGIGRQLSAQFNTSHSHFWTARQAGADAKKLADRGFSNDSSLIRARLGNFRPPLGTH